MHMSYLLACARCVAHTKADAENVLASRYHSPGGSVIVSGWCRCRVDDRRIAGYDERVGYLKMHHERGAKITFIVVQIKK